MSLLKLTSYDDYVEINDAAKKWMSNESKFSSIGVIARKLLAEYIANQKGLTFYDKNVGKMID